MNSKDLQGTDLQKADELMDLLIEAVVKDAKSINNAVKSNDTKTIQKIKLRQNVAQSATRIMACKIAARALYRKTGNFPLTRKVRAKRLK
jgi:hypothetical protein